MSAADKHNELAQSFVFQVASQTRTEAEMMVVVESVLLASMLVLHRRHGLSLRSTTDMVESAVQTAMERFTEASR